MLSLLLGVAGVVVGVVGCYIAVMLYFAANMRW